MKIENARHIAEAIHRTLSPFCEKGRCIIAGSIRRDKPEVHDIEIVVDPLKTVQLDLFQNEIGSTRNQGFIDAVQTLGDIEIGKPTIGRYVKIMLPEGIKLDLFIPQPHDFWRQLVIRTGSSDYSKKVAQAWRQLGWVGTDDGLRSDQQCDKKDLGADKHKWVCNVVNPILPPVWQSEQEFFDWLKMPYLEPKDRI